MAEKFPEKKEQNPKPCLGAVAEVKGRNRPDRERQPLGRPETPKSIEEIQESMLDDLEAFERELDDDFKNKLDHE